MSTHSSQQFDIIALVKNPFKYLYQQTSFDRVAILLAFLSLISILMSEDRVRSIFIGAFSSLVIILFVRLCIYSVRNRYKGNPCCHKGQEATSLMMQLANEMSIKLCPNKPLDITPNLVGARSTPWPFFSGWRFYLGGRVHIGCILLYRLDDLGVKCVIAHELAHLKKGHSVKVLLSFLLCVFVLIYWMISNSTPIIPILLTSVVWTFIYSLISWHHEYEADAVAADYVGKKEMANALKEVADIIYRPGDTLAHPSFKKRITRLLSDKV